MSNNLNNLKFIKMSIKIEQFKAKNQFILTTENGVYFESYGSVIVFKPNNGKIQLDINLWDYSKTTSKYRSMFLGETTRVTQDKINYGEYELINLN